MQNSCLALCVPYTRQLRKLEAGGHQLELPRAPDLYHICWASATPESPVQTGNSCLTFLTKAHPQTSIRGTARAGGIALCGHSVYFQVHGTAEPITLWEHTSAIMTFHQSPTVQFRFVNCTHYDSHNITRKYDLNSKPNMGIKEPVRKGTMCQTSD